MRGHEASHVRLEHCACDHITIYGTPRGPALAAGEARCVGARSGGELSATRGSDYHLMPRAMWADAGLDAGGELSVTRGSDYHLVPRAMRADAGLDAGARGK
jgi:hypothetical protein